MFGILSVDYRYGSKVQDLQPIAKFHKRDTQFLTSRIGTTKSFAFRDENEILASAKSSFHQCLDNCSLTSSEISQILFVGQVRLSTVIPGFSHVIHNYLSLSDDCLCIDIGHGCSGYLVALDLAFKHYSATSKYSLIITCDPYRSVVSSSDLATSLLFSDGLSVSIVGSSPSHNISDFTHFTDSSYSSAISLATSQTLYMNGRQVLDYGKTHVTPRLLDFFNIHSIPKSAYLIPHHGSKAVVDLLKRTLGDHINVVWDSSFQGNTISSSIPICWSNTISSLPADATVVLCGFGVGLSTSICTVQF